MVTKKKRKQITYRIWRENNRGDDTVRSFRSLTPAAKHALNLHKKGMLNSINIATGRSVLSERRLTKSEFNKFDKRVKKLVGKNLK